MSGRRDGQWHTMTWREADRRVRNVAGGLLNLGFKKRSAGRSSPPAGPNG